MNPDKSLSQNPFLKIIVPAAAGIALSGALNIGPVATGISCLAALVVSFVFRKQIAGRISVWCTVLLFFLTAGRVTEPRSELPAGKRIVAAAQIRETPAVRGRWQHTTADIGYYRMAGDPDTPWIKVDESVQLSVDTTYAVAPGMQIAFRGWLNPIDTTGSSYGELMRLRGYHGRIYLTPGNMLRESPHVSKTPAWLAQKLHRTAVEKLDRLDLSDDSKAVVTAMTTGDKRGITPALRQAYSRSGAAHLLAVSGLHVGIVFMLINIMLYMLPALRRGHLVKNAAAIVAIWLYAMAAGLSPSVVRAAIMFSFAQLALASSSRRGALNIILGSAVVMLAINPNYAGDMSFLMSYTAVLSIIIFLPPIYRMAATKSKPANNALIGVLIVGLVASAGNAPLVSYWFGNFSLIGILLNPVVIFTAHLIVLIGVFWLLTPGGILAGPFSFMLDFTARAQNAAVEWGAEQEWAIFSGNIPRWSVFLCYSVLILSAILAYYSQRNARERPVFSG